MKNIAVLGGGWSSERVFSLGTATACAEALRSLGYSVVQIDVDRDLDALLGKLMPRPDAVFNGLMGRGGEDGQIQGVLEILDIPYTHSGVLASALAMNKAATRAICHSAGIPVAAGGVVTRGDVLSGRIMAPPLVFKPIAEGGSIGVRLVRSVDEVAALGRDWPYDDRVLMERFIPGKELSVAVLDSQGMGAIEVEIGGGIFDEHSKYESKSVIRHSPPRLPPDVVGEAISFACGAHDLLGCRGLTRVDFRCDDTGSDRPRLFMLELNTQPGMSRSSLVPEIAANAGMAYAELVRALVEGARTDSAASSNSHARYKIN